MKSQATVANVTWLVTTMVLACSPDTQKATQERPAGEMEPAVVVTDLNGPMGLLVEPDGTIWVVDSGVGGDQAISAPDPVSREVVEASFGETSRIIRVDPSGEQVTVATLPSLLIGGIAYGGDRLAMLDHMLYATSGGWVQGTGEHEPSHSGVVRIELDQVTEIVNTREYEATQNPDPAQLATNPYGLTVGPDSMLWMTDAAGNALYRVDPEVGSLQLITVFKSLPGPVPNPARGGALEVEPVPTAIAFLKGEAYVSFLPGLPMEEGTAKVVRVSRNGDVTDYATGLSRLTDLQAGPDGDLYAVSMGIAGGSEPTGSIVRIGPGMTSETVVGGLSLPTALAFDANGNAYVTINGVGAPGSGHVIKYSGLAQVHR